MLLNELHDDPDVKKARAKWEAAKKDLGPDLGGFSLVDLLADNFEWPLAKCKEIAAKLKSDDTPALLKKQAGHVPGEKTTSTGMFLKRQAE